MRIFGTAFEETEMDKPEAGAGAAFETVAGAAFQVLTGAAV